MTWPRTIRPDRLMPFGLLGLLLFRRTRDGDSKVLLTLGTIPVPSEPGKFFVEPGWSLPSRSVNESTVTRRRPYPTGTPVSRKLRRLLPYAGYVLMRMVTTRQNSGQGPTVVCVFSGVL